MLELKHISKIYNPGLVTEMCLFDDFNFTVNDGEFVSVIGSNGSGKTSMLNIICGSIPVNAGEVLINGKCVNKKKDFERYAYIGRVYQNPSMGNCPNMTILENMSLADNKGKPFGLSFALNKKRYDFYREQLSSLGLGLEDKLHVKMGSLSGGQRQAVSLVMATLTPIDFLILDEHTAALDPKTAEIIMELTDKVVKQKKLTAVMVTHNLRYAVELTENVLCGKALDDRSCVAILLKTMEALADKDLSVDLCCLISTQEELGTRGATVGAFSAAPDYAIALDVTFASTPDTKKSQTMELRKGAAIGVGPNMHRALTQELIALAKEKDIPCQLEIMGGRSGTDGWPIQVSREGVATLVVSLPIRCMHTPVETMDLADAESVVALLTAFIPTLGADEGGKANA